MDLIGPFPAGTNNETYYLTSIDLYSKFLTAVPIVGKTAQVVATAFMDHVISNGANVMAVHSDNGKRVQKQPV